MRQLAVECFDIKSSRYSELWATQCGYEKCAPSKKFGPNIRSFYLLHFVIDGEGEYQLGDKTYHLRKNQGFMIFPGDITLYKASESNPWFYYWVGFNGTRANEILERCGITRNQPVFTAPDNYIKENIMSLYHNSKDADFQENQLLGRLHLLLYGLGRPEMYSDKEAGQSVVMEAQRYIAGNFGSDFSIEELATRLFVDRSYLFRLFRRYLGVSPSEYIAEYRINKAREMLLNTGYGITFIAGYCGFNSASVFCKAFKKRYGLSASKLRSAEA